MAILEKEVVVTLAGTNIRFFEELGYDIPRVKNKWSKTQVKTGTKIKVKVDHLQKGSMVNVTKICDDCGKHIKNQNYKTIINHRKKTDGRDRCNDCGAKFNGERRKINIPYDKSLEFYAISNDKGFLLDEFSDKNGKTPRHINYCTTDLSWWICPKCGSEYEMKIVNRTYHNSNCPFCSGARVNHTNSLSSFSDDIANQWHPLKNGDLTPHDVTYGSKIVVWWKCNYGHEWQSSVNRRTNMKSGCPICNKSKGEKRIRKHIESIYISFIEQKEFKGLIGVNGGLLSYDFYLPSHNLLIEYQGEFHDGSNGEYTQVNLERQQEHDARKRIFAKQNGIELLEIWYWDFENIEHIINNKLINNKEETFIDKKS